MLPALPAGLPTEPIRSRFQLPPQEAAVAVSEAAAAAVILVLVRVPVPAVRVPVPAEGVNPV